jgi:hypothetical protein
MYPEDNIRGSLRNPHDVQSTREDLNSKTDGQLRFCSPAVYHAFIAET